MLKVTKATLLLEALVRLSLSLATTMKSSSFLSALMAAERCAPADAAANTCGCRFAPWSYLCPLHLYVFRVQADSGQLTSFVLVCVRCIVRLVLQQQKSSETLTSCIVCHQLLCCTPLCISPGSLGSQAQYCCTVLHNHHIHNLPPSAEVLCYLWTQEAVVSGGCAM